MSDKFRQWCMDNNFNKKNDEGITHTFMNGGTLYVPKNKHDLFYEEYAKVCKTTETSLVERKTMPYFSLALDLDIVDEQKWTEETIFELVSFIQSIIHDFYKENLSCIICMADGTKKVNDYIKTGVHLHWPHLVTNIENTEILYSTLIKKCNEKYGERPDFNPWNQLIDACVTKNIGLRVAGSSKFEMNNGKYINKGRKYWPIQVLDSNGNPRPLHLNKLKRNLACLMKETSIRSWQNVPLLTFKSIPDYAKEFENVHPVTRSVTGKRKQRPRYGGNDTWSHVNDTETIDVIEKCVYKSLPKEYNNCTIKDMLVNNKQSDYLITLTETNSYCKYCQNVKRMHSKNHIYWILNSNGLYQKCHSETKNKDGKSCADYSSKPISISITTLNFILNKKKSDPLLEFILG